MVVERVKYPMSHLFLRENVNYIKTRLVTGGSTDFDSSQYSTRKTEL